MKNYFIDDLINSNNDMKQKALLQEWDGGPTFYVPLSKLEYYDEVAIKFIYNDFDSYIKKDTGIVYLPSFFYDLIMKGSNVRNLKLEDIPTKKLSNLFNSENTENDILEKANNYYNSGKYKSAQKLYSKYLEKNPDSVNFRLLRAYTFLKTKSYNNAKNDYNKYIDFYESNIQESEMPSELITAYLYRGITLYQLEQYEDALIDFHKVLDSNASNSFAYLYRGLCQRQLSISDLGCSDFQKSFDLGNNEAEIYLCNSEEFRN
jgi:tetratricopeptide (TPR) repeat protein